MDAMENGRSERTLDGGYVWIAQTMQSLYLVRVAVLAHSYENCERPIDTHRNGILKSRIRNHKLFYYHRRRTGHRRPWANDVWN